MASSSPLRKFLRTTYKRFSLCSVPWEVKQVTQLHLLQKTPSCVFLPICLNTALRILHVFSLSQVPHLVLILLHCNSVVL